MFFRKLLGQSSNDSSSNSPTSPASNHSKQQKMSASLQRKFAKGVQYNSLYSHHQHHYHHQHCSSIRNRAHFSTLEFESRSFLVNIQIVKISNSNNSNNLLLEFSLVILFTHYLN